MELDQAWPRQVRAELRDDHAVELVRGERPQRDTLHRGSVETERERQVGAAASCQDGSDGSAADAAEDEVERLRARSVEPLQVVDREHGRGGRRAAYE